MWGLRGGTALALPSGHLASCAAHAAARACRCSTALPRSCLFCGLMGRTVLHLTALFRSADVVCTGMALATTLVIWL